MAYTHSRYEVEMIPNTAATAGGPTALANGSRLDATGIAAQWGPGFVPHIIRGAAVVPLVTINGSDDTFVRFDADLTTPGTPTTLFTINVPTSGAPHRSIFYKPTYYIEIVPGDRLTANVTAAATAGVYGKIMLYVEPRWEEPTNITGMLSTT